MATILTKKSDSASAVPLAGDLTNSTGGAELAVNTADKRLFVKNSGGTVVEVGTNPSSITTGTANATTVDTTNLEVTNIKAKDGTAAGSIADSTGVVTLASSVLTTTDINGGTIDGTAIGASSASTGAFTTLAASSTVTLSGGTANGVLYLNGSKVATSGSALVFDGTNLAIGTGTATNLLTLLATSTPGIDFLNGAGTKRGVISASSSALNFNSLTSNPITWQIDSSEQMRLTSTGLGIGTSTAYSKLYLKQPGNGSGVAGFVIENSANDNRLAQYFDGSGDEWRITASYGSTGAFKPITFWTSDTKRLTLDSSGNLGLGVTPSAWGSLKAIQIGNGAAFAGNTSFYDAYVYSNAYYDGSSWRYINSSVYASGFDVRGTDGKFVWLQAPSGTAGNAITFTQAMTLDASGNLGIGATANLTAKLNFPSADSGEVINIYSNSVAAGRSGIGKYSGETRYYCGSGDIFTWVNGGPSGTERARIDSSGNLLVGTTSAISGNECTVYGRNSGTALACYTPGATYALALLANDTSYVYFGRGTPGSFTQTGSITNNGTTTAYNTSSDYRLKENIAPMTGALDKVAALKPCTYTWKADGSAGEGFIAHELAEVVPQCVTGEKDAVDADGKPQYQGVDTSFLVATLTAAIQEQQAIIESLKSRLDAAGL
jgi:hypothetical protein